MERKGEGVPHAAPSKRRQGSRWVSVSQPLRAQREVPVWWWQRERRLEVLGFSTHKLGFPGGSDGEESACNAGGLCSIPGLGRAPGGGNGNSFSILAWRIPQTEEEPGGLQFMGSKKTGYD